MKKLFIGFDDLEDAKMLGSLDLLIEVLKSHLADGGVVIVERRFENAPPETVVTFNSSEALDSWLRR